MMIMTATILATGPSIDCRIFWRGCSQGMDEPEAWAAAWQGVLAWGRQQGVDWFIGRRLPSLIDGLGLQHTQAKTDVQNIRGRDRGALYFQLFFAEVREPLLASGLLDAKTFDAASALLDDPTSWTQCWMMTAVWGRKDPGTS